MSSFYFKNAKTIHDVTFARSEDLLRGQLKEEDIEHVKERLAVYGWKLDTF